METQQMNGAAVQMYCKITEMISMSQDFTALQLWLLPLAMLYFVRYPKDCLLKNHIVHRIMMQQIIIIISIIIYIYFIHIQNILYVVSLYNNFIITANNNYYYREDTKAGMLTQGNDLPIAICHPNVFINIILYLKLLFLEG